MPSARLAFSQLTHPRFVDLRRIAVPHASNGGTRQIQWQQRKIVGHFRAPTAFLTTRSNRTNGNFIKADQYVNRSQLGQGSIPNRQGPLRLRSEARRCRFYNPVRAAAARRRERAPPRAFARPWHGPGVAHQPDGPTNPREEIALRPVVIEAVQRQNGAGGPPCFKSKKRTATSTESRAMKARVFERISTTARGFTGFDTARDPQVPSEGDHGYRKPFGRHRQPPVGRPVFFHRAAGPAG